MWINNLFLFLVGISSGLTVAFATLAFIDMLGIVVRLIMFSKTKKYYRYYQFALGLGIFFGGWISIFYKEQLPLGDVFLILYGSMVGIFVGLISISLAETLKIFPILLHRLNIKTGIAPFVIAFALGKVVGSLYYFLQGVSAIALK